MNRSTRTIILLPIISLIFAYAELGGNWFAYRMIEQQTIWSVSGTIIFSTAYSFIAAGIAKWRKIDLGLLMVNYGFGFSIVSLLLKLEWNEIPQFTLELLNQHLGLLIVLVIAILGFVASGWFVVNSSKTQNFTPDKP